MYGFNLEVWSKNYSKIYPRCVKIKAESKEQALHILTTVFQGFKYKIM